MQRQSWLYLVALSLPLLTGGCGDIGSTASSIGDYMPTLGDRCESTECITDYGKATSDSIKEERLNHQKTMQQQSGAPADSAEPISSAPPAPPVEPAPSNSSEPF